MMSTQGNTIDLDSARKLLQPASGQQRSLPALHQRLLQVLQTSLEIDRVLELFFTELQSLIPVDGLEYQNSTHDLQLQQGKPSLHRCSYRLNHGNDFLGELQFSRAKRFRELELSSLETLLSTLLYPLRNALMYHEAVSCALRDNLTGAGNRLAMDQAINREVQLAIRNRTPLSLLVLDLDRFKQINDIYGHAYGDQALKTVVDCTRQCLRAVDGLYRLGGEEFVVVLGNTDLEPAKSIAERIRSAVENLQFKIDGQPLPMTVSLGVAIRHNDETGRELLDRCDKLMYAAKHRGRNTVVSE